MSISKKEVKSAFKKYSDVQLGRKHSSLVLFEKACFLSYLRKTTQGRKSDLLARTMKKIAWMVTAWATDRSFSTEVNNESIGMSTSSQDGTTNVTSQQNQKFYHLSKNKRRLGCCKLNHHTVFLIQSKLGLDDMTWHKYLVIIRSISLTTLVVVALMPKIGRAS